MSEIRSDAPCATFINTFRCEPAHQDEVVSINIDIVEQVAARSPGFLTAAVHRSSDGTRVINYLQWESAEHLAVMQRSPEFTALARRFDGLIEFDPPSARSCTCAPRPRWLVSFAWRSPGPALWCEMMIG